MQAKTDAWAASCTAADDELAKYWISVDRELNRCWGVALVTLVEAHVRPFIQPRENWASLGMSGSPSLSVLSVQTHPSVS